MKGDEVRRHDKESALYQKQLEAYISTYIDQGYTPDELQDHLSREGYDVASIRNALKSVNNTYHQGNLPIHMSSEPHKRTLLIVGLLLIILSVAVYFYFIHGADYEFYMGLDDQEIVLGSPLEFTIVTTKLVDLEIKVTNLNGELILAKNDQFDSIERYFIYLPRNTPQGAYTVDFFVTYKENTDHKSFSFSVIEKTNVIEVVTSKELDFFADAILSNEVSSCATLETNTYQDQCYVVIARETKNNDVCSLISSYDVKDNCYLSSILNGEEVICSLITSPQDRATCISIS